MTRRTLVWALLAGAVAAGGCGQRDEQDERPEAMATNDPLSRAAALGFADYDPAAVVTAVNMLQQEGKAPALRRIERALDAVGGGGDRAPGLFWVLRVLFEVPPGERFPPVRIGRPSVEPPEDPAALPRFPIVLAADVPFLVVRGYDLAGLAEPVEAHVEWFREHGTIRQAPLRPRKAEAEATFRAAWTAAYGEAYPREGPELAREQLARMPG